MLAMESIRQWTATVNDLLGPIHAHQSKALALISAAMLHSGRCDSGHVPLMLSTKAKPASGRRRIERVLANPRLVVAQLQRQLTQHLLAGRQGPIILILDETPKGPDLRCMKISLAYRHRAVPLVWECYRPEHPPLPMPKLLWRLCSRVARVLGPQVQPTLLADRGLSWPTLLDAARSLGWHYVLRLQASTRVRFADGSEHPLSELVRCRGDCWLGEDLMAFKKAGWRKTNLVGVWERRCKDRWLLATDLHASYFRCSGYAKRTWCEELHRDEKSQGLNWQRSRVQNPAHAKRLLLLMALATILALSLGAAVLKRGWRKQLESTRQRRLSLFQLGRRWLVLNHHSDTLANLLGRLYLIPP